MVRSLLLGLATFIVLLAVPMTTVLAQDDEAAPPTEDEIAAKYLKDVKKEISKQAEGPARATIAKLVRTWQDEKVTEDTKKVIPGYLEKFTKNKEVTVVISAVDALAGLGAEYASKPILNVLGKTLKAKQPSVDIYGACLRSLKKLHDPNKKVVKELTKLLKRKEDDVVAKTADAMSGYVVADGKLRKDLLEELIKSTEGVYSASRDSANSTQVRKWNIIQSSVMKALNGLSKQKFKDPTEARKWYNDNKKNKKAWE